MKYTTTSIRQTVTVPTVPNCSAAADELGLSPGVMELVDRIAVLLFDAIDLREQEQHSCRLVSFDEDSTAHDMLSEPSGCPTNVKVGGAMYTAEKDNHAAEVNEAAESDKNRPSSTNRSSTSGPKVRPPHNPVRPYPAVVLRKERAVKQREYQDLEDCVGILGIARQRACMGGQADSVHQPVDRLSEGRPDSQPPDRLSIEQSDQDRTARNRTDLPRNITLCRRCELAVRKCGKYILRKSRTERIGRVRSCGVCHARTRCDRFEIGPLRPDRMVERNMGPLMPERAVEDVNDGN